MHINDVAKCIQKFAPEELAAEWDNCGILIDCLLKPENNSVLLTVDLTEEVVDECIKKKIEMIVAYHPVIFKPIKRLDSAQKVLIRCIKNNISVYSPHSQLDPLMNKYILDQIIRPTSSQISNTLDNITTKIKSLSGLKNLRIVKSKRNELNNIVYNADSIIVGVGATFRNVNLKNCLIITGEMSHHDLLKCKFNGVDVIMMEHSNSERVFLPELKRMIEHNDETKSIEVFISEKDVDPVTIY